MHFLKSQVGSRSKSYDLFGDLVIFYITLTSEASRNILSIFSLNLISAFVQLLQVLFQE